MESFIFHFLLFLIGPAIDRILAYRAPIRLVNVFLLESPQMWHNFSCYHCASMEYKPLFRRFEHLNSAYRSSMNFGNFCDISQTVQQTSPASSCEYSCVTIFEPQFFGGKKLKFFKRSHFSSKSYLIFVKITVSLKSRMS